MHLHFIIALIFWIVWTLVFSWLDITGRMRNTAYFYFAGAFGGYLMGIAP